MAKMTEENSRAVCMRFFPLSAICYLLFASRLRHWIKRVGQKKLLLRRLADSPWQELRDDLPKPAGRHTAILARHPSEPGTFFARWEPDVYRSVNRGANWARLDVPWPENFQVNEICPLAVTP